jgi:hypothetical protein
MASPDRTDDQGTEAAMKSAHANQDIESLDHKSSRSICEAVGERLQQTLRPDSTRISSYLQHLIDELRKRDEDEAGGLKSN